MKNTRFWTAAFSIAAWLFATGAPLAAQADTLDPASDANELGKRKKSPSVSERRTRRRIARRHKRRHAKLRSHGIRTLRQLARANRAKLEAAIGAKEAAHLIRRAKLAAAPTSIIDPSFLIDPTFIVDPTFLIDPTFKTDARTKRKFARARRLHRKLRRHRIRSFRQLRSAKLRAKLVSVVGAKQAKILVGKADKAEKAGFITPQFVIDPSFLVESNFIIVHIPPPSQ